MFLVNPSMQVSQTLETEQSEVPSHEQVAQCMVVQGWHLPLVMSWVDPGLQLVQLAAASPSWPVLGKAAYSQVAQLLGQRTQIPTEVEGAEGSSTSKLTRAPV